MLLSSDMKINLSLFIAFCFIIALVIHEDHAGVVLKNFKSRRTLIEELEKDSNRPKLKKDTAASTKSPNLKPKIESKVKSTDEVDKGLLNEKTNKMETNISNSSKANEKLVSKLTNNKNNLLHSSVVYVTLNDKTSKAGSSDSLKKDSKPDVNCPNCSMSTMGRSVNGGKNHKHPIIIPTDLNNVSSNLSVEKGKDSSEDIQKVSELGAVTLQKSNVTKTVVLKDLNKVIRNKTETKLPVKNIEKKSSPTKSSIRKDTDKTKLQESSDNPLKPKTISDSNDISNITGFNSSESSESFHLNLDHTAKAILGDDSSVGLTENITEALHNLLPSELPNNNSDVSEKKNGNLSIDDSIKVNVQSPFNVSVNATKQEAILNQKSDPKVPKNTDEVDSKNLLKISNHTHQKPHANRTQEMSNQTQELLTKEIMVNSTIAGVQENKEKAVQSLQEENVTVGMPNHAETMNILSTVDNTNSTKANASFPSAIDKSLQSLQERNDTKTLFQQDTKVNKSEIHPNTRNDSLIDGLVNDSIKAVEPSNSSEIASTNITGLNESGMGFESMVSAGLSFLANSEVAKNAAIAMEIFNLSDSSLADHVIEDSDLHGVIDVVLPSQSGQNSDIVEIHSNKTNRNVTDNSDNINSQNSTSFNNESIIEHMEPTSEEMPLELLPVQNSDSSIPDKKCPPPGICVFWFMSRDACTNDDQCPGSKRCCRIRCFKQCVDV